MPPKAAGKPAGAGKGGAKKPAKPKEVDVLEALQALKAEREERAEINPILIKLKKRDEHWRPSRAKKKVKIPPEQMETILKHLVKIQAWGRMVNERWRYRRVRSNMIDVQGRRLVRPKQETEPPAEEAEGNPILKQIFAYRKMKEVEMERPFQKAALVLQAFARRQRLRQHMIDQKRAMYYLTSITRRRKPHAVYCREAATQSIIFRLIRRPAQDQLISTIVSWKVVQACARRSISAAMERNRSVRVREIFHRAVRAQRMWLFRAIWERRDAIVIAQAMSRRMFANVAYIRDVTNAREAARFRRARSEVTPPLSRYVFIPRHPILTTIMRIPGGGVVVQMRVVHAALHDYVARVNLLRRVIRARFEQSQHHLVVEAASVLGAHMKAISAQLRGRKLSLRMPLLRLVQAEPNSFDVVRRTQSLCRVWCMEAMGQPDQGGWEGDGRSVLVEKRKRAVRERQKLKAEQRAAAAEAASKSSNSAARKDVAGRKQTEEQVGDEDENEDEDEDEDDEEFSLKEEIPAAAVRQHLSHQQKREAVKELQAAVRRTLASSQDESLTIGQSFGYARVLEAGELVQASVRAWNVRRTLGDLMRQYAAMTLQAMARMKKKRAAMCSVYAAQTELVCASRRAADHHWHIATFEGQIVLQRFARMRATPEVELRFPRMPTRELARILQAHCRRALDRRMYAEKVVMSVAGQALIRRSLARGLFLSSLVWLRKAKAAGREAHSMFGSLVSTHPRGQALWRTRRYVERKGKWAEGAGVRPAETTERERIEERRRKALEQDTEKERVEKERRKAGLLFRVDLAVGTGKVVTSGRLARVYGKDCVVLDPKTSSNIEGEYRHFFLNNGGESRRIEKYSADHMAWVYPPFSVRPVVNTVYHVVDEEMAPYERNLVKERRERQAAAALALQMAWRGRLARKIVSEEDRKKRAEEARIAANEEKERQLVLEREAARRKREAEEAQRRRAAAEGRRLLMEEMDKAEAERRARRLETQARKERLWGLHPKLPVLPARPRSREPRPPSRESRPASREALSVGASPAPPPRSRPAGSEESFRRRRLSARPAESEGDGQEMREMVVRRLFEAGERSREEGDKAREIEAATRRPAGGRAVRRKVGREGEGRWVGMQYGDVVIGDVSTALKIRKEVRERTHSLYVDMAPPELDEETKKRLAALEAELEANRISAEEHAVQRWAVMRDWKHSPQTSPRTLPGGVGPSSATPFDASPKKTRPGQETSALEDIFETSRSSMETSFN